MEKSSQTLRFLFELFNRRNIRLQTMKCKLYYNSVRWCGRTISETEFRFDPHRIDGNRNMQSSKFGADLQQFVCALQRMKTGISNASHLVEPLQKFLERVYETRALVRIVLPPGLKDYRSW